VFFYPQIRDEQADDGKHENGEGNEQSDYANVKDFHHLSPTTNRRKA
jgi:hypothetical protein